MESEARHEHADGIGTWLRACRLKRGDDLVAVARILRIRSVYLKAIEDGRFDDLPGPTYAAGFVRAYAEYLGLDGDEVIRRFKVEVSGIKGTAELHFPSPRSEGGTPRWAVLFGGAIFALLSYGVWYVNSTRDGVVAEFVTSVPERLGHLVSPGDETGDETEAEDGSIGSGESRGSSSRLAVAATGSSDQPGDAPHVDAASRSSKPDAAEESATRSNAAPDTRTSEEIPARTSGPGTEASRAPMTAAGTGTTPAAVSPNRAADVPTGSRGDRVVAAVESGSESDLSTAGGEPTGTSFGDSEDARIMLKAKAESWIQVRDEPNDRVLLARLLRPGDVYRVPNRPGLNLWTGNAGGLEILVDGEPVPSIGEAGAVRRRVLLEVGPLRTGAAIR